MPERRIAYLCPTLLHLMNCIITQLTVNKEIPADLIVEDVTDFSEITKRLMKYPVFENCYTFPYKANIAKYWELTGLKRRWASVHPEEIFPFPDFPKKYTDLCVNIDSYPPKFFYYGLRNKHMSPTIHFVSEGTGSYSLDFSNTTDDGMLHAWAGKKAFLKNIGNLYVYKPELYTGRSELVNKVQLPQYSTLDDSVHQMITDVFGQADPIHEKVIFFEGMFWGDNFLTDEIELLLAIADHVGKENIIIKRHPRNTMDRFTPLGFKVMANQTIPWEVMIKDIDLSQKVLVSVASFTSFSAMELYDRSSYSILLKDLMRGRVAFLENPGYKRFFQKAETVFNSEAIYSWSPESINELHLSLDILSDKVGGWKCE